MVDDIPVDHDNNFDDWNGFAEKSFMPKAQNLDSKNPVNIEEVEADKQYA
jgi:hypothetical protein